MAVEIGTSGADFRSRTKLASERIKEQVRRKIVAYGTALLRELVLDTPILTGQAKANWQASIGAPGTDFIGLAGRSNNLSTLAHRPPDAISYPAYNDAALAVINSYQVGQVLFIYSNLPYLTELNNGSSKQAPQNFIQTAVMRASASVRK